MDKRCVLNCVVNNIKFTGLFDGGLFLERIMTDRTHSHYQYEIHVIANGEYFVEDINGKENIKVTIGDVVVIPPNFYHSSHAEDTSQIRNYAFRLEIDYDKKTIESEKEYNKIIENLTGKGMIITYSPWAIALISEIKTELLNTQFGSFDLAEIAFKKLIIKLLRTVLKKSEKSRENLDNAYNDILVRNETITLFFDKNFSNPDLSANDLATHLNLSVRQLNRVFREVYNISFHKKLIEIRLALARKFLLKTNYTVEEVAEKVGFSSSSGFFVAFKKEFGVTPNEFRQNAKSI